MSPSLLKQQLAITGSDDTDIPPEILRQEAERMESLVLPPLVLPPRRGTPWRKIVVSKHAGFGAAIFAVLAVTFFQLQHQKHDDLKMRGELKVFLYAAHDGAVGLWQPGASLKEGDRVRVELLAPEKGRAYTAVVDRGGTVFAGDALTLAEPGRRAFPGSVQLTGANDGESLIVLWSPVPIEGEALQTAMRAAAGAEKDRGESHGIAYFRFRLR